MVLGGSEGDLSRQLLIWLYGSLHWADNQLPSVAITVAALLHRELEGGELIVHKVHCLLGFRLYLHAFEADL